MHRPNPKSDNLLDYYSKMTEADSVVFEIQVDKEILRQLLLANKNFTYEHAIKLDENVKCLTDENSHLKDSWKQQEQMNKELRDENFLLKGAIKELEIFRRIFQEKSQTEVLEHTENKLYKMKLQSIETEKSNLVRDFEKEKDLFDQLLTRNNNLQRNEEKLKELEDNLANISEELRKTRKQVVKLQIENNRLDQDKLQLEDEVRKLMSKVRTLEQRDNSMDLEMVESKLLKLKLQSVENEKQYLLADFERERKVMNQQNKPRIAKLEDNLKHLRQWIEKEAKERRPRDSHEVKQLKAKVDSLEHDRKNLIEGFEMERKVFQKILREYSTKALE